MFTKIKNISVIDYLIIAMIIIVISSWFGVLFEYSQSLTNALIATVASLILTAFAKFLSKIEIDW